MAYSRTYFTVQTNGQTLVVSATFRGGTPALHLTTAVSSAITQPYTITSDTTFYVLDELAGDYVISCKQPDGTELYGLAVKLQPGDPKVIAPLPSAAQVGADLANASRLAQAPSGAIAETFSRAGGAMANGAALSTGRLHMASISLTAGMLISSISVASVTTALSGGSNQWFALYNADRTLVAQTADDTSTAWGSNTVKTLSFASPVTLTRSGLYYIGVNVTATTVPSLAISSGLATPVNTLAPVMAGTSSTGLTDTAPATAAALTVSSFYPYAYVS